VRYVKQVVPKNKDTKFCYTVTKKCYRLQIMVLSVYLFFWEIQYVFLKSTQEPTVTFCDTCIVFSEPVCILDLVSCVIKCMVYWNNLEHICFEIYCIFMYYVGVF
jgi:hypothetical protein